MSVNRIVPYENLSSEPQLSDRGQMGPMILPPFEIAKVLLPPSDLPAALATAEFTARVPPFGNECLPATLIVAVLLDVS